MSSARKRQQAIRRMRVEQRKKLFDELKAIAPILRKQIEHFEQKIKEQAK